MNIQAMMKQAQKMQKDMMEAKAEIDQKTFTAKSSLVTVNVKGTKEVENIQIAESQINADDIEMVQDMIVVALNDAMKQIDQEVEQKLGKYTQGMPGLF